MELAPYFYASPELNLTEYHIRKLTQSFYGVGATSAFLFLGEEHVFTLGKTTRETQILSQIKTQFDSLEGVARVEHPLRIGSWKEGEETKQAILFRIPHKELFIFAILVQGHGSEFSKNRWLFLSNTILAYLSVGVSRKAKTLLSFRSFTEVFRRKVCDSLKGFDSGVLGLFYLQDLSPFFKPLGIIKSQEILREVSSTLQAALLPGELFFQLNVRSFYLFSPGELVSGVNDRLQGLYFPSKHMILDYRLKLYQVSREIAQDPNQFSDLFMEIL